MTAGAAGVLGPEDEGAHPPGPGELWQESWTFEFALPDGSAGGFVRLGLLPLHRVAWYWASLVFPGRPLVTVVDFEVPLPRAGSLEIRGHELWADQICETPFDHWSVANETYAVALDDPDDAYGRMLGTRVPLGFDLEWEQAGEVTGGLGRYAVPSAVHGEVLVGDERLEVDAAGRRDHMWGTQDWWTEAWSPQEPLEPVVATAPVLVPAPDGSHRTSRLLRALCRTASGYEWREWNRPDPPTF